MKNGAFYCLFLLLTFCSGVSAQMISPKHTFNVELGLPNSMGNKPFNKMMQGLANLNVYYQYAFANSLAIGGGLRYSFFEVNEFRVPEPLDGGMHSAGAFLKISREKFHSDRFGTDMGVKFGYSLNYITTDLNEKIGRNPYQNEATYIEPCIGLVLSADEFTSYRFHIGYAFQGFGFNPNMLGTESSDGYSQKDFDKSTHYLVIGFGFTYYFKPKT